MSKPFLSVIIPAYNESKRLPLTLIDIDRHLSLAEYSYEIIVVDDGSKDSTSEIAERLQTIIKNLKVINNKDNHGKGWVVRQGMLASKGNWRLFTDADNSTSISHFDEKILPFLSASGGSNFSSKESYDIFIGSRAIKGSKLCPPQPFYKRILGKAGNVFIQIFALEGIKDTQCGFKCFSEESAEKVFRLTEINRWAFDVEALMIAKKLGYKIKEVPVVWVNDFRSSVNLSGYFYSLFEVLKIRWKISQGKYKF